MAIWCRFMPRGLANRRGLGNSEAATPPTTLPGGAFRRSRAGCASEAHRLIHCLLSGLRSGCRFRAPLGGFRGVYSSGSAAFPLMSACSSAQTARSLPSSGFGFQSTSRHMNTRTFVKSDLTTGPGLEFLLPTDCVEEVGFWPITVAVGTEVERGVWPHGTTAGGDAGISFASLRRFWAVAARWNSSRAPHGPRNRRRSSLRMRLRWANSISTFLR
jgi:hypothetical protein